MNTKQRFDLYRLVGDKEIFELLEDLAADSIESYASVRLSDMVKDIERKIINVTNHDKAHRLFFKDIEENSKLIESIQNVQQSGLLETPIHKIVLDLEFAQKSCYPIPKESYFINGRLSKTNHQIMKLQVHHIYQLQKPNLQFLDAVACLNS